MKTERYSLICKQKNAFRVSELQDTLRVLQRDGISEASVILKAIRENVVETPEHYKGEKYDLFCLVTCSSNEADVIVGALVDAEANSISETGEATPETGTLVYLVDKWFRYKESL